MAKIEFQQISGDRYRIVGSNNIIVSKSEKNKLEKKETTKQKNNKGSTTHESVTSDTVKETESIIK